MAHNKSFERNARLEGEIRSVLSNLLRSEVNDPRLADVTVSTIRLSADRSKARVFYSVIGDSEQEREAGDGFSAAAPFMRRQLGQRMRLRVVPSLEFHRDTSYEYGDRMERLFDRLSDEGLLPEADNKNGVPEDES
ncbi:MAG: 30S ribosome-binding factor RbfA [Acidobacteria bacterium]|uniref:Ribosome-binding factor A n=1 Tax=Candidatus Sulfomarinibacter kjeldsenii TaxID=2885994 RepID=A0A8J6YAN8_9BACT|nr:30S ribosome-binding factor RbfA [Candidatus Sulfomarinibacter kjeldsenii]